ncbi:MAG: SCO family protein [Bacteroidota bacterium]
MRKHLILRWGVVALLVMGSIAWAYQIMTTDRQVPVSLPVYGEKADDSAEHRIAPWKFIDQNANPISQSDLDGKIYVADFFFTTCNGICPKMSNQMERVAARFKGTEQIHFLSHTVKPSEDSVSVLKKYADFHNADSKVWHFVTGDKKEIYEMARTSYLSAVSEGDGGPDDFVHTQFFTLVDAERRIRGFYDGTDSVEVNKLIDDIYVLMNE